MAYTPQQIVELVNGGRGPNGMYSGSDQSGQLSKLHKEIADDMLQLQGAMQEHWQGDGAGQAYAGAGPLVQASQVSGEHLTQAQGLYTGQGSSFKDLQGKVATVGDLGNKPDDDWVSDTPLSFLSNRSDEIDAWNQKAQQVVDGYNVYHGQSTDNSGRWTSPSQYGELGLPPGGADIKPVSPGTGPGSPGSVGGSGQYGASGSRGGTAGDAGGVGLDGGGSGHDGGPDSDGGPDGGVPQQGGHAGSSVPPPGGGNHGSPGPDGSLQSGGTTTAGYVPPVTVGGHGAGGGTGGTGFAPGGPGPGGAGPGGGTADGFVAGGGFGPGGGFGSGMGSGTGSGAGAGSNPGLGAGKGSGTGGLGGEPGVGGRAGGGVGGTARPGGAGMAGAGGMGGRGGKGEEESEHKTADYLLEQDPDDALVGELPKATPPVIGL